MTGKRDISLKLFFFRNFLLISSATYGNCFTFNSVYANSTSSGTLKSVLPGATMGLELVLNLNQKDYMKGILTQSAGAR